MSKIQIILEIITLLQGTPVATFARDNFGFDGKQVFVRCARDESLDTSEGQRCKGAIATAFRRYSYRFTAAQISVFADLYVSALQELEPGATWRVRERMCDSESEEARRDASAAEAVCERLSVDF